jgi:hypothetical protein
VAAKRCLILLAAVLGVLGAAVPDDGLEHNRQLLLKWRADPEHDARLERDWRAFLALSPADQDRLARLDRQLHELPADERRHLFGVLERYAAWLERLPDDDRKRLASAAPAERLRLIGELRERQFIDRLPERLREEVRRLPPEQRAARVTQLRREDRIRRREWQRPGKRAEVAPVPPPEGQPARLVELPPDVRAFVTTAVLPRLGPWEKEQLSRVEDTAGYLPMLATLANRHPVFPPGPGGPVTRYDDLPEQAKELAPRSYLENKDLWKRLTEKEGHWPEFALAFVGMVPQTSRAKLPPLGASRPQEFAPGVQEFLAELRKEHPADADRLHRAEGHWPEYPRQLLEVARRHKLHVPGMTPPGPREWWEPRN